MEESTTVQAYSATARITGAPSTLNRYPTSTNRPRGRLTEKGLERDVTEYSGAISEARRDQSPGDLTSPALEGARVPFRAGRFGATGEVALGRVSGPVTPTPRGARGYGFKALGGVGCVERSCFTGCLMFAPQGRHSPSGHHEAPTWRACPQGS